MNRRKSFCIFALNVRALLILITLCVCFLFQFGCHASEETAGEKILWSFVVYSDNRGSNPTHRTVLASIAKIQPNLILNLGDLVFRASEFGTLNRFKKDVKASWGNFDSFNQFFYPTIGGHEERYYNQNIYPPYGKEPDNSAGQQLYHDLGLKKRVANFNEEYGDYYFTHKNIHFIMMYRSDEWKVKKGQLAWLERILRTIPDGEPIIATGHDGDWFLKKKDENHEKVRELLKEHHVEIELAADFHDYYVNTDGTILQMRSGSAGWGDGIFIRFDVTDTALIITAFEPDGVTPFRGRPSMHPSWIKEFGKQAQQRG